MVGKILTVWNLFVTGRYTSRQKPVLSRSASGATPVKKFFTFKVEHLFCLLSCIPLQRPLVPGWRFRACNLLVIIKVIHTFKSATFGWILIQAPSCSSGWLDVDHSTGMKFLSMWSPTIKKSESV